ncbi:MAG: hypothetical protein JWQ60_1060 [Pseudonocardia sp.]|jgi:hypothetical protein|nr:hypothetical protein [Pseudonocardia sp.]
MRADAESQASFAIFRMAMEPRGPPRRQLPDGQQGPALRPGNRAGHRRRPSDPSPRSRGAVTSLRPLGTTQLLTEKELQRRVPAVTAHAAAGLLRCCWYRFARLGRCRPAACPGRQRIAPGRHHAARPGDAHRAGPGHPGRGGVPAAGTPTFVTSNADFYRIDVALRIPSQSAADCGCGSTAWWTGS